jgi:hypothetical protein
MAIGLISLGFESCWCYYRLKELCVYGGCAYEGVLAEMFPTTLGVRICTWS